MELILALERMLWTVPLPLVLMGSHLYFTLHLRGIQRHTLRGIRLSLGSGRKGNGGVSAWGALATSLAAAIGTGNIIGVATAVALGGPGAVFWCWLTGVFGMATRYGETLVCLNHRAKKSDGSETGGAMYVMRNVLGWRKMGALFAVMGIAAAVGTGALIQSNAIAQTLGEKGIPLLLTGIIVTVMAAAVILGGVGSIAKVCEGLVPAMSILYLLGCAAVLVQCRTQVIPALVLILKSAVTPRAAGGGFVGSTIVTAARYGMARGLFTNESGMGTAPMAAAAGPGEHPQEESLISMTGVFWDTVVICAMTGITLVAAMLKFPERFQEAGVGALCFRAFSCIPGGETVLMISLITFAFSTVVGWCYYGECCTEYLLGRGRVLPYRIVYLASTFLGAFAGLELVWSIGGILAGLMAVPNVMMLFALRKEITAPRIAGKRRSFGETGCFSTKNQYNKRNRTAGAKSACGGTGKEELL